MTTSGRVQKGSARQTISVQLVLFAGALFITSGLLDRPLSGFDPYAAVQEISAFPRYLRYATAALIVGVAWRLMRNRSRLMSASAPHGLVYLPIFIFLTLAVEPGPSLVQFLVMMTTIGTSGAIVFAYGVSGACRCFLLFSAAAVILSAAVAILMPSYGTILAGGGFVGDLGSWIGLFSSKNEIGPFAALTFVLVLFFGATFLPSQLLRFAAILSSLSCVLMSRSGNGIISIILLSVLVASLKFSAFQKSPVHRFVFGAAFVILVATVFLLQDDITDLLLDLAGKDRTFTGRTVVWVEGMALAGEYWPTGAGIGFTQGQTSIERTIATIGLPHYHNAYIEWLINLGAMAFLLAAVYAMTVLRGWQGTLRGEHLAARHLLTTILVAALFSGTTEPNVAYTSGVLPVTLHVALFGFLGLDVERRALKAGRTMEPRPHFS